MALREIIEPFFVGPGGQRMSAEQIARQRQIASALMQQGMDFSPVGHWTQGLARVANAAAGAFKDYRAGKAEAQNAAESSNRIARALGGFGGQDASTAFPAAPAASSSAAPTMDYASSRVAQAHNPQGSEIAAGLVKRGLPQHVADAFVMNMKDESGLNPGINEANPVVPGSRGGFGLSQWTGPRRQNLEAFAAQRGVAPSDTNAQLDFLMSELQGPERSAYDAIMAAPDTGSAAAAIVNKFLRPAEQHRASREARYLRSGGGGSQIASALLPEMAGNVSSPVRVAQAGGINPAILEMLSSPYATSQERNIAGILLQQQMQQSDPMRALEMQKMQMEMDALRNPRPEYDFMSGRDGAIFRTDKRSGQMQQLYGGKPDQPSDVKEYEYARQQGYQGSFIDFQMAQKKAGASQVNIDQKTEGAFDKKLAEGQAEAFNTMATEGMDARADIGIINELDGLLQGQGGAMTGLQGWLAQKGVDVGDATSDLQAAQALINKLVPTQRQAGSGSMSDRDVELFTRSLPNLFNTPQGNQKIIGVMRGMAEYKQAQGDIADQVMTGEISRQEARRMLRDLPNPLSEFRSSEKQSSSQAGTPPQGVDSSDWEFMTPEERKLFQ